MKIEPAAHDAGAMPGELEQRRRSAADVLHLDAPTSAACAELARRAGIPAPGA